MIHRILLSLCFIAFASQVSAAGESITETHKIIIHNYVAAFNAQDTEAMLAMVTDDIQWLTVDGDLIKRVYYFPAEKLSKE